MPKPILQNSESVFKKTIDSDDSDYSDIKIKLGLAELFFHALVLLVLL